MGSSFAGMEARRIAVNIAKLPMPDRRFPPPWTVEEVLGWIAPKRGIP
jgi:hypothetical protein